MRSTGEFAKSDKSVKLQFDSSLETRKVQFPQSDENVLNMYREISDIRSSFTETYSCRSESPQKFSCAAKEFEKKLEYTVSYYTTGGTMHMILGERAGESVYLRLSDK
jgi:hypothetical protein